MSNATDDTGMADDVRRILALLDNASRTPMDVAKEFFEEKYGVNFRTHRVIIPGSWADALQWPELKSAGPESPIMAEPGGILNEDSFMVMKKGIPRPHYTDFSPPRKLGRFPA